MFEPVITFLQQFTKTHRSSALVICALCHATAWCVKHLYSGNVSETACIARHVDTGHDFSALLQAKQREQAEFEQRAARIRRLEARRKQEEEAAVKALGQQLLAQQVLSTPLA